MAAGRAASDAYRSQAVEIGSVRVHAPAGPYRHVQGTNGEMWQWIGDGRSMVTYILASRRQRQPTAAAVRHLLNSQMARITEEYDSARPAQTGDIHISHVPGSRAAFRSTSNGVRSGIQLHDSVLIASDAEGLYISHMVVPNTDVNRDLARAVTSSLEIVHRRT